MKTISRDVRDQGIVYIMFVVLLWGKNPVLYTSDTKLGDLCLLLTSMPKLNDSFQETQGTQLRVLGMKWM